MRCRAGGAGAWIRIVAPRRAAAFAASTDAACVCVAYDMCSPCGMRRHSLETRWMKRHRTRSTGACLACRLPQRARAASQLRCLDFSRGHASHRFGTHPNGPCDIVVPSQASGEAPEVLPLQAWLKVCSAAVLACASLWHGRPCLRHILICVWCARTRATPRQQVLRR